MGCLVATVVVAVVVVVVDAINAWILVAVSNRSHIVAPKPPNTHTQTLGVRATLQGCFEGYPDLGVVSH